MTHPLTDDIIEDILLNRYWWELEPCQDALRDAADWQLEQDAKHFAQYLIKHFGFPPNHAEIRAEWFKEAMRPQQQKES